MIENRSPPKGGIRLTGIPVQTMDVSGAIECLGASPRKEGTNMAQRRRICAWLFCLIIASALFVSSAYAVHEAGHICHGAGCRICETVRQAEALVQSFTLLAGCAILALTFKRHMQVFRIAAGTRFFAPCTLISWKVRLNN